MVEEFFPAKTGSRVAVEKFKNYKKPVNGKQKEEFKLFIQLNFPYLFPYNLKFRLVGQFKYWAKKMEEEYASSYSVQTEDHGNPNLAVVVRYTMVRLIVFRVRPESQKEAHGGWRRVIKVLDEHVLVFDPAMATMNKRGFQSNINKARDHKYAFDRVFDETASQQAVFEVTTKPLIETVMSGCNATVFCYGATGNINSLLYP